MIRQIDEAMVALQRGVFALEHLGAEHPSAIRTRERACELIREAMGGRNDLSVMCAAGRIVALDQTLPSSEMLLEGLFARLEERGISSLTFMPGISSKELTGLISWIHGGESGWEWSKHVQPGSVEATPGAAGTASASAGGSGAFDPESQVVATRRVWTGVSREEWDTVESIEEVVSAICGAVTGSSGMLLPLASLKRHDEYTFVHTTNVAILSAALAESVGLDDQGAMDLTTAALLHDVGKRSTPRALLNKAGKLTDQELQVMRRHPTQGARILFNSKRVPDIVPIVAFEHHIHLDGSGYPNVRPGWRTSMASQIVQVADVYDALRTNRPYRAALSREEAYEIMMKDADVRFDKALLDTFFERVAARTDREALPEMWSKWTKAA